MIEIRKMTVVVDEVFMEANRSDGPPLRRAGVMATVKNPLTGVFQHDLRALMESGGELAQGMVARLLDCFGGNPESVESYGKGALVGTAGEIEHGFALITRPFAKEVRRALVDASAWMASNVKRGAIGATLDVPLAYKKALYVRSHYDTVELAAPDAPLPDEVVVFLVGANRGRTHARIGGLQKHEVTGPDTYCDRE